MCCSLCPCGFFGVVLFGVFLSSHLTVWQGLTDNNMLPKGVLLAGPNAIQASVDFFEKSKSAHAVDEMMPIKAYERDLRKSDSDKARQALFNLKKSHEDLSKLMKK